MSLSKEADVLRHIPLFAKIEPAKLKLLAYTSERLEFMAGDELFHQGDHGDAAYIVLEGQADILVDTPKGAVKVASLGRNDIIGEIAILCNVPRTATVVAGSDLTTLLVKKEAFIDLVTQSPQVGIEVMSELASRLNETTQALTNTQARLREIERAANGGN